MKTDNIYQKAKVVRHFAVIAAFTKNHLDIFENFCIDKSKFADGSAEKDVYGNALIFQKKNDGEWIEYRYFDRFFRLEVHYTGSYQSVLLRTYEVFPGIEDRSKKRYELISLMDILGIPGQTLTTITGSGTYSVKNPKTDEIIEVPLTTTSINALNEEYIELLWAVVLEPSLNR